MTADDSALLDEAILYLNDLFTHGVPLRGLWGRGELPDGWQARYLDFVERVTRRYGDHEPLPREILAVLYSASVYCTKRCSDWQRLTGGVNTTTEQAINEIRWAGDRLILGRFWRQQGDIKRTDQN